MGPLPNYLEEIYDTNPLEEDSDLDLISDRVEVGYGSQDLQVHCGVPQFGTCLLYTSPSPRDQRGARMPSSA